MMDTKIGLWSSDETVDIGKTLMFTGFLSQIELYFNRFGHLPKRGDIVAQDEDSTNKSAVIYIESIEYGGIQDGHFVLNICLTSNEPK